LTQYIAIVVTLQLFILGVFERRISRLEDRQMGRIR
jgi:hypothetical protein